MELVHGPTLAEVLAAGPLPSAQMVQIAQGVLAALNAAHERGVLHRDVKPSNVLLRNDGTAVLGEFGISQLYGDPALTAVGTVVGSIDYPAPDYRAPERALGGAATPATDLWALAASVRQPPPAGQRSPGAVRTVRIPVARRSRWVLRGRTGDLDGLSRRVANGLERTRRCPVPADRPDPNPEAGPLADWQDQEPGVADRLGGYDRITIEPVVYRDYDAADWEYT